MTDFWATNGFYLWALTTALVLLALAWLAWNTFGPDLSGEEAADIEMVEDMPALISRVNALVDAAPHMQATLGRALQRLGLVRYTDVTGAQAFALALTNARGDGVVLSSSVRGGFTAKAIVGWAAQPALSKEEQEAVNQAHTLQDTQ